MTATIPPITPINLETFLGPPARIPGGLENGNILPDYMNGPVFTPRSQQQASIEALNRALTGDLSASLTGGDRLLALAALMRSATRSGQRAGLTPQQVIGDLRQQQVQQAQARLQIEQLRAAEAQQRQQIAAARQFAETLPEEQRQVFLGLPLEQQMSRMDTQAFRQRQWVGTFVDDQGRTRNRYLDGTSELADYNLPADLEIDTYDANGDGVAERVVLNKVTREIIETRPLGETPNQIAAGLRATRGLDIREREANRPPSGGGGGRRNAPTEITDESGNRVVAQWDPASQQYYLAGTNRVVQRGVSASSANPLLGGGVVGAGTARFGGNR